MKKHIQHMWYYLSSSTYIYDYANETQLSVTRTMPVLLCIKGILSSA
jgi:hypothetical protein